MKDALHLGEELNLTRKDPTMKKAIIGAGWDFRFFEGDPLDMDLCAFLLDKDGMTREDEDFIFYNNDKGAGGAIRHTGDNRTGAGEGDDETIFVDLNGMPYDVHKVVFVIAIYQGEEKDQHFGMVKNAFIRIVNEETGREMTRFDLTQEEAHGETGLIFCELVRDGVEWRFKATGEFIEGGLPRIATNYGIIVSSS